MTADDRRPPLPPAAHPDLDTLADLHADALDGATAERVRTHASSCPRCGPVLAALDGVRDELHALPAPPMPAPVAARLDATLADLRRTDLPTSRHTAAAAGPRAANAAAGGAGGAGGAGAASAGGRRDGAAPQSPEDATWREKVRRLDELELARDRRRARLTRSLGAVAAAVAVIAAGASITAVVRSSTSSDNSTASAGSAADSSALPAPAAISPSTGVSIPSYDQESLRAALPSIVQRSAVAIITGEGDTGPAGAMADAGRRTACAGTIGGSRGELRAVLRIRYQGAPAYVFVYEAAGGARTGVVVSDDCGTSSSNLPASVLGTVS
jgi:hypothetical protein